MKLNSMINYLVLSCLILTGFNNYCYANNYMSHKQSSNMATIGVAGLIGATLISGLVIASTDDSSDSAKDDNNINFKEATIQVNDKLFYVQIADTPKSRQQGLMFRENTYPYDGMLFVFPQPGQVKFWMKNTLIALDIYYFDANKKLLQMYSNAKPLDTIDLPSESFNIQYILELPTSSFPEKLHIGDKLRYSGSTNI